MARRNIFWFGVLALVFALFASSCASQGETDKQQVGYESQKKAIVHGLEEEGNAASLGVEIVQGKTYVFFLRGSAFGTAQITYGEKGFTWSRIAPYTEIQDESSPVAYIYSDPFHYPKHPMKLVLGVVNDKSLSTVHLYLNGNPAQSKPIIQTPPHAFYFLISGPEANSTTIEVKGS